MPQVNIDQLKMGIKALLPILELIAARTPSPYDDAVVAFLKLVLVSENPQTVADHLKG